MRRGKANWYGIEATCPCTTHRSRRTTPLVERINCGRCYGLALGGIRKKTEDPDTALEGAFRFGYGTLAGVLIWGSCGTSNGHVVLNQPVEGVDAKSGQRANGVRHVEAICDGLREPFLENELVQRKPTPPRGARVAL